MASSSGEMSSARALRSGMEALLHVGAPWHFLLAAWRAFSGWVDRLWLELIDVVGWQDILLVNSKNFAGRAGTRLTVSRATPISAHPKGCCFGIHSHPCRRQPDVGSAAAAAPRTGKPRPRRSRSS